MQQVKCSEEVQAICAERFKRNDARMEEAEDTIKEHSIDLASLKTNVANITKSLDGVTKALWAVALSIMSILFGFVIWYIQNGKVAT